MADRIESDVNDCALSLEEIQNMKVADLRKKLKAFGLPVTGNKTELVERLQEAFVSDKGEDSFENSQLSYDEAQIDELERSEILGESPALDQNQFPSYISSSLNDNPNVLDNGENRSSSNSVIMPPKKRTFTKTDDVETVEKKVLLKRTNANDIDFEIEENDTESKPVTLSLDGKGSSDERIKLSLKNMSAAERLAMRAKRFNTNESGIKTTTDSLKSIKSTNSRNSKQSILSSATAPDLDVLKKRAERFGQCVSTVMKQIEHKEKLLKRKCKFGANLAVSSATSLDEQAKKKQRAERFGVL